MASAVGTQTAIARSPARGDTALSGPLTTEPHVPGSSGSGRNQARNHLPELLVSPFPGLLVFGSFPRLKPWAIISGPSGAATGAAPRVAFWQGRRPANVQTAGVSTLTDKGFQPPPNRVNRESQKRTQSHPPRWFTRSAAQAKKRTEPNSAQATWNQRLAVESTRRIHAASDQTTKQTRCHAGKRGSSLTAQGRNTKRTQSHPPPRFTGSAAQAKKRTEPNSVQAYGINPSGRHQDCSILQSRI